MSTKTSYMPLTILRVSSISRILVLFTMYGLSSVLYYPILTTAFWLLLLLILDFFGLIVLLFIKQDLMPLGYGWTGLVSIVLMVYTYPFLGNTFLTSDVSVILILSGIQLLTLIKIGYDRFIIASEGSEIP